MDVTFDIHSETRRLWDRKTEVKGNDTWDTAQSDEDTPHEIDTFKVGRVVLEQSAFVRGDDDDTNDGSA